ncbi:glycosyltransferase [Hydrogenophaga sp. T2]|uniref:glycosyltransferase n=1 Tax=Hydrogenophaga sp. T2 TaxID=3132823 RepID=UPI003CE6AD0E
MKVIFVHQNFPAQFLHLAPAMAARGHEVHALRLERSGQTVAWNGVTVHAYVPSRGSSKNIHPWLSDLETKVIRGEAVWKKARELKAGGWSPDLIYAHPGWGEALYLKEVWPEAKLVLFGEFFYSLQGADTGFDPEFSSASAEDEGCRLQMKNLNQLAQLQLADMIISPTQWQASRYPEPWRDHIQVVHDGIDTEALRRDPGVSAKLPSGQTLTRADEVITFVARHLEPYRGFHVFMRALPRLLRQRPRAHVIIVGEDGVSYGAAPKQHKNWREHMLAEVGPQLSEEQAHRVHFVGRLDRTAFTRVLQLSRVHVYLTYPFVLSWSLIEAMSVGCAIVASDTPPVAEVISPRDSGLLTDFFDPQRLSDAIAELLSDEGLRAHVGAGARERVLERFDLRRVCLPRQTELLEGLTSCNRLMACEPGDGGIVHTNGRMAHALHERRSMA